MVRYLCMHMKDAFACTSNNCMHAENIVRIAHRTLACMHTMLYLACILQIIGLQ